ncbi:hypothetical protein ACTXT7_014283 [Hymenolepis weldensis]
MAETVLVKDIEIWSRGFSVSTILLLSLEENVLVLFERSYENTRTESDSAWRIAEHCKSTRSSPYAHIGPSIKTPMKIQVIARK